MVVTLPPNSKTARESTTIFHLKSVMEQRYIIIALSIALPVLAAFGWTIFKAMGKYNKRHNIISIGDAPMTPSMYSLEAEEAEKSYKDYVNDNFC